MTVCLFLTRLLLAKMGAVGGAGCTLEGGWGLLARLRERMVSGKPGLQRFPPPPGLRLSEHLLRALSQDTWPCDFWVLVPQAHDGPRSGLQGPTASLPQDSCVSLEVSNVSPRPLLPGLSSDAALGSVSRRSAGLPAESSPPHLGRLVLCKRVGVGRWEGISPKAPLSP